MLCPLGVDSLHFYVLGRKWVCAITMMNKINAHRIEGASIILFFNKTLHGCFISTFNHNYLAWFRASILLLQP